MKDEKKLAEDRGVPTSDLSKKHICVNGYEDYLTYQTEQY